MRAQLESHVESLEKQADLTALAERADSSSLIDLIVVTDSEAVLGIGGKPAAWFSFLILVRCR
jgi:malic enzyme